VTRHDLFISHSSADAVAARELRALLQSAGYSCWMAPDDVTGTDPWAQQILAAIDHSRAMLVLVSAKSNGSTHVAREVELASSRGRIILPFRVEAVAPVGALEYHLAGLQRIDAFPPPIGVHRAEILRRLSLTVPLAGAAGATAAPAASGDGPITASADVPPRSPSASKPSRLEAGATAPARPTGGGGLSAWARANGMVAGSIVTLAALFLIATLGFALSSPQPTKAPDASGSARAVVPSASVGSTVPATAAPTTAPSFAATASGFPISSGGPFPNEAERALFAALPEFGKSVIEDCERTGSHSDEAAVWMQCYADDGELLFYSGFADPLTQRKHYLDYVRGVMERPQGSCATSPTGDEAWTRPDGRHGHLACAVDEVIGLRFFWADESTLISVSSYADSDDIQTERAKLYQEFLEWTGG
jgi:TIR domain